MPADKTVGEEELEEDDAVEERGITVGKGRATPSRRRQDEAEEDVGFISRTVTSLREYFEGVRSETSKVIWPTREEARRLTIIVLITLLIAAIILGSISLFFTELFRVGLGTPIILLVFMLVGLVGGFFFLRALNRSSY